MEPTTRITQLERDLRELIKRWDRFFSGELPVPPIREKNVLNRRLRQLGEGGFRRSADQFRIDQLQHRFMSYATNWERMLREREEGVRRYIPGRGSARSIPPPPAASGRTNAQASPSVNEDELQGLFGRWKEAKEGLGQKVGVDASAFEAQIETQRRQLEKKFGQPVKFEVKVESGRVKLTARRVGRPDGEEN